jgi:hypothetical protein
MSLAKLTALLILCTSSLAFADDNERKWTIHAARMYAEKGNVEKKPVVDDPGVFVTAQRDPQNTK